MSFDEKLTTIRVVLYSFGVQKGTPSVAVAVASAHETSNIIVFVAGFTSKVVGKHVSFASFDVKLAAIWVVLYTFGPQMLLYKHIRCPLTPIELFRSGIHIKSRYETCVQF